MRVAVPSPRGMRLAIGTAWRVYGVLFFGQWTMADAWQLQTMNTFSVSADGRYAVVAGVSMVRAVVLGMVSF
jgi:hypothetical protein